LALFVLTGCQSYYPNGYGYNGPYSAFPTGPYVPTTTTPAQGSGSSSKSYPTRVDGKNSLQSDDVDASNGNGSKGSKYQSPPGAPDGLGAPAGDDDEDTIRKKGTSSRGRSGGSAIGTTVADSSEEFDDGNFVRPVEYQGASDADQPPEPRRLKARSSPSPYKKDPQGYSWLRGVVSRDPKSGNWCLTYNRDTPEDDIYEGILTLADDAGLDNLKPGDVILVEGNLDRKNPDRFGKPSYRVVNITPPLVPKSN
jgi:hypothetical protein